MRRQANVSVFLQTRLACFLVIAAVFCCASVRISAQTTPTVLTNAADVLSLSAEQARQKIPVFVRGVVTAAEPTWRGQFFLQDETSGVFIENKAEDHPEPGDLVEVK